MPHYRILDQELSRQLAEDLLNIQAVILRPNQPMTWASGWNSPIYCDNRLTLRHPALRAKIRDGFLKIIDQERLMADVITGTATAGIPHAAWVAERLEKPLAYVRSQAKAHGLGNQIEGGIVKGESTIVIEDLVSTGGSALSVVDALEVVGAKVTAVLCIFTYGFEQADEVLSKRGLPLYALTDYPTLIQVARGMGRIGEHELATLNDWRSHPDRWPM